MICRKLLRLTLFPPMHPKLFRDRAKPLTDHGQSLA